MKYIGTHVSSSGGIFNAPLNASEIGANAYACFTKSQRQWIARPLTQTDINLHTANHAMTKIDKSKVLVHDSYLINLCNNDTEKNTQSLNAFIEEMRRVKELGLELLNFHPGAHLNQYSEADACKKVAENLNCALFKCKKVYPVIETTAGQGTNIGYRFEHLASIIDLIEHKERVKVCIDTCHIFAAGYDIRTKESYEKTMAEFDSIIGFDKLAGMHLNDSKKGLNSRVDRHESLGQGEIGIDAFKFIINDKRIKDIPLILETPNPLIWKDEIAMLRSFEKQDNDE